MGVYLGEVLLKKCFFSLTITSMRYQGSMLNWTLQFPNIEFIINTDHLIPIGKLSKINWGSYEELISQYSQKKHKIKTNLNWNCSTHDQKKQDHSLYSSPSSSEVLLYAVSVTCGQPQSENMKWTIPEINNS